MEAQAPGPVASEQPALRDYDLYAADVVLREAVTREGADWAHADLHALGRLAGGSASIARGVAADRHRPTLHTHDSSGNRLDEVEFHPAYHQLLRTAVEHGLHTGPCADARPGAQVARAAGFVLWTQVDAGVACPTSMTYASAAALSSAGDLDQAWLPTPQIRGYDPALRPVAAKRADGAATLLGLAITERQGGSDLRATSTRAVRDGSAAGSPWRLTGHKQFCSAPMSDGFLTLGQSDAGLSCFLLPRVRPDGSRNAIRLGRLEDTLGNRSAATTEIELDGAHGTLVGDPGRGLSTIAPVVALTRLDCVLAAAALMRQAVAQAIHHSTPHATHDTTPRATHDTTPHATHDTTHRPPDRRAFDTGLVDALLTTAVLADLAVESEAATALALRLAGAVDRADDHEVLLRRIGTAAGAYYVCRRGPHVVAEALECLGGDGHLEESGLPRLYRSAPVTGMWAGAGNVTALDALRVLARRPSAGDALLAEVTLAAGGDGRLDAFARELADEVAVARKTMLDDDTATPAVQRRARRLVERMALGLQGSLLVRHAPAAVADAFCASRLAGEWGSTMGTLPATVDAHAIVARHAPVPHD